MATFLLDLVTPERRMISEQVTSVMARGVEGYFGVYAGHAPKLSSLATGLIKLVRPDGSETYIAAGGGFLQVTADRVIILADSAEIASEINLEQERAAVDRARKMLELPGGDMDASIVKADLDQALNRIKIAGMKWFAKFD